MGCDIHICIQVQEPDGDWREVVYQSALYPHQVEEGKTPMAGIPVAPDNFTSRNYDLFAVLADVRNGSGFAGVKTGDGWPSIAPDRGLPEGFDAEAVAANPTYAEDEPEPRYLGDHSHTWLLLDELKGFAWDLTSTRLYGYVPAEVYEELKDRNLAPRNYCGGISGPDIKEYTPDAYEVAKHDRTLVKRPHVQLSWTETAREATNDWPGAVIPWLESLAESRRLRLVIGFDS